MMHHSGVVVAITDNTGKAYREYDFTQNRSATHKKKSATVLLPFDTEYAILLKNTNQRNRIKVDIEIDGTVVTDKGVIIDADDKVYLERFVDVPRKFKFVHKDSDDVADPTNEQNGVMKITVQKEIANVWHEVPPPPPVEIHHHHHYPAPPNPIIWGSPTWCDTSHDTLGVNSGEVKSSYSCGFSGDTQSSRTNHVGGGRQSSNITRGFGPQINKNTTFDFFRSNDLVKSSLVGEAGATVEGEKSDQTFKTTRWLGNEGTSFVFEFTLRGKTDKMHDPDYEKYLELKAKFE